LATYTYKCSKCNERFEAIQSVKDDPLTGCQLCEASDTIRRIIVPGGSFRIGGMGVNKPTARFNTSDDIQYRKG